MRVNLEPYPFSLQSCRLKIIIVIIYCIIMEFFLYAYYAWGKREEERWIILLWGFYLSMEIQRHKFSVNTKSLNEFILFFRILRMLKCYNDNQFFYLFYVCS